MATVCPFCKKKIANLLQHYRLIHEIESSEQYIQLMLKTEEDQERKDRFAKYVDDLQDKVRRGLITPEDYRRLIMEFHQKPTQ